MGFCFNRGFQRHCTYQVDKIRVWDCTSCCKLASSPTLTWAWEQSNPMLEVEVPDHRNEVNTLHANKRCGTLSYCGVLHSFLIPARCSPWPLQGAGLVQLWPDYSSQMQSKFKLQLCTHACFSNDCADRHCQFARYF